MSNVHYDGFISYRHNKRDTQVAVEVQHALEHFHIPKIIKEKYHKNRFERIFRDEEELNTGANLAEKIEDALNNSDYLIIICSKEYMQSKWCLLEVETFLKNHDHDHVLCVLSDGEPPEIFPEALLKQGEPLACDYRMDFKEARRVQLPKLASTMIGCNYDELVMRQEKYRRRRALILISIIMTLAAIAISYLLYSNARIRENYNNTLINESKILAKESLDLYDQKDRYNAIKKSLEALPSIDFDRPITDEAQFSLTRATYAYRSTRHSTQTGLIDSFADISEYFVTHDSNYLIYLDIGKKVHTYDLKKKEEILSFGSDTADISDIHEGKDGQLILCGSGKVSAYDYLSGEKKWETSLENQTLPISHPSNDHKLIGVIDNDKIRILSAEGEKQLDLSLSEDQEDHIRDFVWSKDDKRIAVYTRDPAYNYKVGVFDIQTQEFNYLDEQLIGVLYLEFSEDGDLYLLEDIRDDYSSLVRNVETNVVSKYALHVYKNGSGSVVMPFASYSIFDEIKVIKRGEDIVLVFGNQIHLFDSKGNFINVYSVRDTISKVLFSTDDNIHIACANGYVGDLYYEDGHSVLIKNFPEAYDDIISIENENAVGLNFLVLKDGDILLFENTYDDAFLAYDQKAFYLLPLEKIIDGDLMMVKIDNLICFADLDERTVMSSYMMNDDAYYHLLDLYDSKGYVLMCEANKQNSLLTIDVISGKLLESRALDMYDFYESQGFFTYPLDIAGVIFYDKFYAYPAAISVYDHVLYYHDFNDPNTIHINDLKSGEERSISLDLGSTYLVNNSNYFYPSELLVFGNGDRIFTTVHDFSDDDPHSKRSALWIDLNDSSVHFLDDVPTSGFYACGNDSIIVYSDENSLNIVDTDKGTEEKIPTSQKAISFFYHENRLYVLNPDNTLIIYENGKEIRKVILECDDDISMCPNKLVRFEIHEKELFVYVDQLLFIINLDSDSSRTLYDYQENVLGYHDGRFIVYGYDGRKNDLMKYLGEYERYSLSELIERAQKQLEGFN